MDRRRTFSFALPLIGLLVTLPELIRLFDARSAAEACLGQAQDPSSCPPAPELQFFVIAGTFGLLFLARLGFLAWEYWRSER